MRYTLANNVRVVLTSGLATGTTSITVNNAVAPYNNPPAPVGGIIGVITLTDSIGAPTKYEIISYTGVTDNGNGTRTLTGCIRGLEGTTAQSWDAGNIAFQSATAGTLALYRGEVAITSGTISGITSLGVNGLATANSARLGLASMPGNGILGVGGGRTYLGGRNDIADNSVLCIAANGTRAASGQGYYLGATDSATVPDLLFVNIAGFEQARITHGGALGLGVNPLAPLHISRSSNALVEFARIDNPSNGASAAARLAWRLGTIDNAKAFADAGYNGTQFYLSLGAGNPASEILRLTAGIGASVTGAITSTAASRLNGSGTASIYVGSSPLAADTPGSALTNGFHFGFVSNQTGYPNNNFGGIFGHYDANGSAGSTPRYAYQIFKGPNDRNLYFRSGGETANTWDTWKTFVLAEQSNGSVVISGFLDVNPSSGLLFRVMESGSGSARRIQFSNSGTVNTIESTTGSGATSLALAVDGVERMRILTGGNVLIGTTTDGGDRLRVAGRLSSSVGYCYDAEVDDGTSGASKSVDWPTGHRRRVLISANTTLTLNNPGKPCSLILKVTTDATNGASHTITWATNGGVIRWAGGIVPDHRTGNSKVHIFSFYFDGTNYYGSAMLNCGG